MCQSAIELRPPATPFISLSLSTSKFYYFLIRFILNNTEISTDLAHGLTLLDFVRYYKNLTGTKIGCREGDCGACVVLVGELKNEEVIYQSFTSCLTPLGNIHGKHVVTIEGLNLEDINPIQEAMQNASATQCGFCTPGFVVSLAGFCLSKKEPTYQNALASIDGNICRCTGYKSIERAAAKVAECMKEKGTADPLDYVSHHQILPSYFSGIRERLRKMYMKTDGILKKETVQFIGGGTDLYVQKHEEMQDAALRFFSNQPSIKGINKEGTRCIIGAAATVTDIQESELIQQHFPLLNRYIKLISSTPIRNMATIGGNFVNASPIGDLTIFFLALNATIVLTDGKKRRELPLKKLYKGYKTLDKSAEEWIEQIWFELPAPGSHFHFEKVSKRTHLDIASVNSALHVNVRDGRFDKVHLSAGGVAAIPMLLEGTAKFLEGKWLSEEIVTEAIEIAQEEISPISDARGTEEYKRLLLAQLIKAHFLTLFPQLSVEKLVHV